MKKKTMNGRMVRICEKEIIKLAAYYANPNINARTISQLSRMWAQDFEGEIHSPDLLQPAICLARKRSRFFITPKEIIDCYKELMTQRVMSRPRIEHAEERYVPSKEEWARLREKIQKGQWKVASQATGTKGSMYKNVTLKKNSQGRGVEMKTDLKNLSNYRSVPPGFKIASQEEKLEPICWDPGPGQ